MLSNTFVLAVATALFTSAGAQTSNSTGPVTGTQGNATVIENNPPGIIYTATLPETPFFNPSGSGKNIKGSISATANSNGIGVAFDVDFSNLPTSGGPFLYHIHAKPVPTDGNCTGTGAHLDPYLRGETPACDGNLPQTCQVGDLSGKHGKVTSDPFQASYTDDYPSTLEGLNSYFGNLSVTVHFGNKTRITCANFTLATNPVGGSGPSSSGNHSATNTKISPTATQTALQYTGSPNGAAPKHKASFFLVSVIIATVSFLL